MSEPKRDEVEAQLRLILATPAFARSPHLCRFLQFTVERALDGRAEEIKEYLIGSEVLGRGAGFDPRTDTIVRTQAHRLRTLLQAYYADKPDSPVVIGFAKGAYVPIFRRPSVPDAPPAAGRIHTGWLLAAAAAVVVAGIGGWWVGARSAVSGLEPAPARFTVDLSPQGALDVDRGSLVLPPSGRSALFPLIETNGVRRLWIRSLASGVSRPLVGSDGGYLPFWSPDESQIGFFQNGRLKVYRLSDGQMRDLAEAPLGRGGAWSPQGTILYAPRSSGFIYQIPEQGGQPAPATFLAPGTDENDHRWPEFLPDGRRFLYSVRARNKDHNCVRMGSLDSHETTRIFDHNSQTRLAHTRTGDFLVFARDGSAWAQPFDVKAGRVTGQQILLLEGVRYSNVSGATFSIAGEHYLVYHDTEYSRTAVSLLDRTGHVLKELTQPALLMGVSANAAGRMLALEFGGQSREPGDVYVGETANFAPVRLTFGGAGYAAWEADGHALIYLAMRDGLSILARKSTQAGAEETVLWKPAHPIFPTSVSADGRWLAFHEDRPDTLMDLSLLPLDPLTHTVRGEPVSIRKTRFNETHGFLANSGRYLAFVSDESGQSEVYVTELGSDGHPGFTRKVSLDGGVHPRWRQDDGELYYLSPTRKLMAVRIEHLSSGTQFAKPVKLFDTLAFGAGDSKSPYAVSGDGRSFIINTLRVDPQGLTVHAVADWVGLLKTRHLTVN
ncbi:TolB-like translocation protein [Paludibaculum fermentans]|uniref:PD40 domain-containing protein n=1 Tax=Paludibaculum fermentans TaxID=1473598 RepID=A0A7S7NT78_PALFE|nr:PD40 domain-containing protein [Paludibaculum fermentans]QOY89387.1 PD40 domain-containing protein [Paludibaculum fermentans]